MLGKWLFQVIFLSISNSVSLNYDGRKRFSDYFIRRNWCFVMLFSSPYFIRSYGVFFWSKVIDNVQTIFTSNKRVIYVKAFSDYFLRGIGYCFVILFSSSYFIRQYGIFLKTMSYTMYKQYSLLIKEEFTTKHNTLQL